MGSAKESTALITFAHACQPIRTWDALATLAAQDHLGGAPA